MSRRGQVRSRASSPNWPSPRPIPLGRWGWRMSKVRLGGSSTAGSCTLSSAGARCCGIGCCNARRLVPGAMCDAGRCRCRLEQLPTWVAPHRTAPIRRRRCYPLGSSAAAGSKMASAFPGAVGPNWVCEEIHDTWRPFVGRYRPPHVARYPLSYRPTVYHRPSLSR